MKRFIVFGGDNYYPTGGAGDCIGSFDTKDEAVEHVNKWTEDEIQNVMKVHKTDRNAILRSWMKPDIWWTVFDQEEEKEVESGPNWPEPTLRRG